MTFILVYVIISLLTFIGFVMHDKYRYKYVDKETITVSLIFSPFWPLVIPTLIAFIVVTGIVNIVYRVVNK